MIKEFSRVVLLVDLPEYDLKAGDVATVCDLDVERGYALLEVFTMTGWTVDIYPATLDQIRPLRGNDVPTVRTLEGHDFPDVGPAEYYAEDEKKAETGD